MRLKRPRLLIALTIIAAALTALYGGRHAPVTNSDVRRIAFYRSRPLPYANAPYYSPAFLDEMFSLGSLFYTGDDDMEHMRDFKGRLYSVVNGKRGTSDQPADAPYNVYIFGNSTLWNAEVPDFYTMPSYLQRRLGPLYRVENEGQRGIGSTIEYAWLSEMAIKPGDIVIFYDGGVDGTAPWGRAVQRRKDERGQLCATLQDHLPATEPTLCAWLDSAPDVTDEDVKYEIGRYVENLNLANAYVTSRGGRFVAVLQPMMWTKPLSAYEKYVSGLSWAIPAGFDVELPRAYDAIRRAWAGQRFEHYDLSHSLDELRAAGVEVFLDGLHPTERANDVMAKAIFDQISTY